MKMEYWKNKSISPIDGELWNDIPGYDGVYQASSFGRVLSCERFDSRGNYIAPKIRSQGISTNGQLFAPLYLNGKTKNYDVSNLVYFAFFGERPDGMKIAHKNKDKKDNRLENIELQTQSTVCSDTFRLEKRHDWGIGDYKRLETQKIYKEFDLENGNRICTKCFQEKPISEFHARQNYSGKNRICAECKNIRNGVVDIGKTKRYKDLIGCGLKKCNKCNEIRPLDQFAVYGGKVWSYCKSCK